MHPFTARRLQNHRNGHAVRTGGTEQSRRLQGSTRTLRPLLGDYHGGQVALAEKISGFFRYARDVAAIQFASYQRNDHAVSKSDWEIQQRAEREFYQPGRFIAIPGFEWSPKTEAGGHHNVYFRRHDQPIRRSSRQALRDRSDVDTDIHHITDLYRTYRGTDTVITPHVGGEHSDLNHHDPGLEPAVEVTQHTAASSGSCGKPWSTDTNSASSVAATATREGPATTVPATSTGATQRRGLRPFTPPR